LEKSLTWGRKKVEEKLLEEKNSEINILRKGPANP